MCSSIQEKSLKVFVADDRIEGFKQKLNLKTLSASMSLTASQNLKTSDDISRNINKCDLLGGAGYIMKCVNITPWINILQITNVIYYKITHGENTHLFKV